MSYGTLQRWMAIDRKGRSAKLSSHRRYGRYMMTKTLSFLCTLCVFVLLASPQPIEAGLFGPSLSTHAGIVPSDFNSEARINIVASVSNAKGKWLGCSIRHPKTKQIVQDLEPVQISGKQHIWTVPTSFGGHEYIVKIWAGMKRDRRNPSTKIMVGELKSSGWKHLPRLW